MSDKKRESPQEDPSSNGYLDRLRNKWQVPGVLQVILILCTFAIGGSLCGFLGKRIMNLIGPDHRFLWWFTYILIVTILWPLCVLLLSIPLGQFRFFKKYLSQMGRRIIRRRNKH